MKRIILEWGLFLWAGMALSLLSLWVVFKFFDGSSYPYKIWTSHGVRGDLPLYLLVGEGDLSLCNGFELDASGNARPWFVDSPKLIASDKLRGDRLGQFTIPGIDLRYYRNTSNGYAVWWWSLRLSLLLPAALMFLLAVLFRRRLCFRKGCRNQGGPSTSSHLEGAATGRRESPAP
jgi:hypothetical protein